MIGQPPAIGKVHPWIWAIVFCCLPLLGLPAPAFPGTITIETRTEAVRTDTDLTTRIVLINQGDETARSIACEVIFQGQTQRTPSIEALPPNTPISLVTTHALLDLRPGQYPVIVRIQFHDMNHYPFTALSALIVSTNDGMVNDLAIETTDLSMDRRGEMHLRLKNLAEEERIVSYWLIVPREISVTEEKDTLSLPKRSERAVSVRVENFAALYGAAYPMYVFFEYDTPTAHHCQMVSATIRIAMTPSWFQQTRIYWMAAGVLLLAAAWFYRQRGKRKPIDGSNNP